MLFEIINVVFKFFDVVVLFGVLVQPDLILDLDRDCHLVCHLFVLFHLDHQRGFLLAKLVPFFFKLAHLLLECDNDGRPISVFVCSVESSTSEIACVVLVLLGSLPHSRKFNFLLDAHHAFVENRRVRLILLLKSAGYLVVRPINQCLFKKGFETNATFLNTSWRMCLGQSLISDAAVKLLEQLVVGLLLHDELLLQTLDFSRLSSKASFGSL